MNAAQNPPPRYSKNRVPRPAPRSLYPQNPRGSQRGKESREKKPLKFYLSFLASLLLLLTLAVYLLPRLLSREKPPAQETQERVVTAQSREGALTSESTEPEPSYQLEAYFLLPPGNLKASLAEEEELKHQRASYVNDHFDSDLLASQAFILVHADKGLILAEKNADARLAPASLCKIMTAYLALEHFSDLSQNFIIQSEDVTPFSESGASVAGFPAGATVSVEDLLYGVLLPSGADACHALARLVSGSIPAFVEAMNNKAQDLQLSNTHFTNPSGLPDPDLYASARDIAKLFYTACQNPDFLRIAGSNEKVYENIPTEEGPLLNYSSWRWKFNSSPELQVEILAGKSGFTGEEQCQATLFRKNGENFILLSLAAPTTDPSSATAITDHLTIMNQLLR